MTSETIKALGVTRAEFDAIQANRTRRALLSVVHSRDFAQRAIESQFMALMLKSDDRLRASYLQQLDKLISTRSNELNAMRAAYRTVSGRSHGTDPAK